MTSTTVNCPVIILNGLNALIKRKSETDLPPDQPARERRLSGLNFSAGGGCFLGETSRRGSRELLVNRERI
jgi:hypothetical protein